MHPHAPKTSSTPRHNADGTQTEEDRQLVNLLLRNAQQQEKLRSVCDESGHVRFSFSEIMTLLCLLPLYWAYSLATRRTAEAQEKI